MVSRLFRLVSQLFRLVLPLFRLVSSLFLLVYWFYRLDRGSSRWSRGSSGWSRGCSGWFIGTSGWLCSSVTYFKFIGVIIDSNLTWSHHINHISNKLSRICGVLSRLKHYVPVLILKIIYNSLFLSHLNYGITAWGFNVGPRIKTLPKKAIRYISNAKYNSHTTPVFKNLQLLQAVDIFKLAYFNFFFINVRTEESQITSKTCF